MTRLLVVIGLLGTMAGCVTRSVIVEPYETPVPERVETPADPHFEAVDGRGVEVIAALRAEPAPVRPQIVVGKNTIGDQRALAARGFVHVGSARYAVDDGMAERNAIELATRIAADQVLLYPAHESASASSEYLAMYYVRFKLLFGATFRNLTATERTALDGATGVEIGSIVGGTPAAQANLIAGDMVTLFNGKPFRDRVEFQELLKSHAGKPVTLTLRRNGLSMDRVVQLGVMPPIVAER
ncbi:MAG: PDZ domain-containing protein [Dokdonella sp.]